MVNRIFRQSNTTVEVDDTEGKKLVQKGHAVEVDAPHGEVVKAETPKPKAAAKNDTKDKAD
ncbi:hypothetical protein [Psychrobacter sp. PSP]|uniref:DUF7302 family protein n=1 Tax=Psychrobacter sp. PSP TaxID=2734636 RepID=UPI002096477E|nr:hypothetical protein [Psychrobacter sp. PSP]